MEEIASTKDVICTAKRKDLLKGSKAGFCSAPRFSVERGLGHTRLDFC